ncbi:PilZ domain-containing protein [Sphingomonas montana]|uniref:PilZ domain-containing protein n=1 Tax=Sphingomonas montana TaxID=1843236 RepID=UPI00096CDCF2|nr:PilZ domain-containing protein [Sphingomonas montana]
MDNPKPASGARDNRRAARHPCNIPATIIVDRIRHEVRIKDVSALGCCLSGTPVLEKGDEIICELRTITVVATIAWSSPPLHGANFHREIDVAQILRDKNRSRFMNRRLAGAMAGIPE